MLLRLSLLFCLLPFLSVAQTLVTYNFAGTSGSQTFQPPASTTSGITASDITRGPGLTAVATPAASGGGISSINWSLSAKDLNDYYEFTVTPNAGYELTLSNISLSIRRTAAGARNYEVVYSIGGGAETTITSGSLSNTSSFPINNALSINTNQAVRFRVYAWGATSTGGSFLLDNILTVNGTSLYPCFWPERPTLSATPK